MFDPLPPLNAKPKPAPTPLCIFCLAAGIAIGLIVFLVWRMIEIGLWG